MLVLSRLLSCLRLVVRAVVVAVVAIVVMVGDLVVGLVVVVMVVVVSVVVVATVVAAVVVVDAVAVVFVADRAIEVLSSGVPWQAGPLENSNHSTVVVAVVDVASLAQWDRQRGGCR